MLRKDSQVKYNCKADVMTCGVACILSNPRLIVKYRLHSLHWYFSISAFVVSKTVFYNISGSQNMQ